MDDVITQLSAWIVRLKFNIDITYGRKEDADEDDPPFCTIKSKTYHLKLSSNICRTMGFGQTTFPPKKEITGLNNASFE